MAWSRSRLRWILVPVVLLAALGTWLYARVAGQVLHPTREAIPSTMRIEPAPKWQEAVAKARNSIRDTLFEQKAPGLSVAVGADDGIVWAEGFGWADVETRAPVTPETRFRIGTASIVLTSAAAGLLIGDGRLKLDDAIQTWVPQFPQKQWPVTLRHVMASVSGIGTDSGDDGPLFRRRCEKPVQALQAFADDALLFQPGTQYARSKYGWILVSAAIETASGQPFLEFMRDRVFQPIGMENTGAESATEENPEHAGEEGEDAPPITFVREVILRPMGLGGAKTKPATAIATVYSRASGLGPLVRYGLQAPREQNLSCYAGSMAFFSTPTDLVRFGLAVNGGALLQPATVKLLQKAQQLTSGKDTGHGLGWDLYTITLRGQPTQAAGHDGELLGRRVMSLLILPDYGIVVALTANAPNADTAALAVAVAEAFLARR